MRLPRWLMIAMLTSIPLSVLGAAGWWWVTWPERTAREFLILIQYGQPDEARQMCQELNVDAALFEENQEFVRSLSLEMAHPRKLLDVAQARQGFRLLNDTGKEHLILKADKGCVLSGDMADAREPFPIQ